MASIRTRARKDGSEYHTLTWREDGKQRALSFDALREAENWKRLLDANGQSLSKAEYIYENSLEEGLTVQELLEEHINQLTGVGLYQIKRYRTALRTHFDGEFGAMKIKGIKHADIVRWVQHMQTKEGRGGKPIAAKTIANQHGLLSAAFTTAVRAGYRTTNPCDGVKLPKSQRTEDAARFITHTEWARIMEELHPRYVPFFQLLIGSGLRFGEATALYASDFVLDPTNPNEPASVRVTKAWKQDDKGGWFIGPPKTRRSVRTVSLSPSTVEAVRGVVEGAGGDLVFTTEAGGPLRSSPLYHGFWKPALVAAGFQDGDYPRVHDVRHSHASWLLATGMMDMTTLSRRLGHESTHTTDQIYLHLMPDANWRSAQVAAKALESLGGVEQRKLAG
jgi:integrase